MTAEDGRLRILQEGRARKFVKQVGQVTFSGSYARQIHQPVLYVTERCVFLLTERGLALTEVAPGIDVERDILAHMEFRPITEEIAPMNARIFRPDPMGREVDFIGLRDLTSRVSYNQDRNILFLNFEGMRMRNEQDVAAVKDVVESRCKRIGRFVNVVVNYDSFRIDDSVFGAYARLIRYMEQTYYIKVTRYSTSAFMRAKLGEALEARGVAPHVFKSAAEAQASLSNAPG